MRRKRKKKYQPGYGRILFVPSRPLTRPAISNCELFPPGEMGGGGTRTPNNPSSHKKTNKHPSLAISSVLRCDMRWSCSLRHAAALVGVYTACGVVVPLGCQQFDRHYHVKVISCLLPFPAYSRLKDTFSMVSVFSDGEQSKGDISGGSCLLPCLCRPICERVSVGEGITASPV